MYIYIYLYLVTTSKMITPKRRKIYHNGDYDQPRPGKDIDMLSLLPQEILCYIIDRYLDGYDIGRLSSTCKSLSLDHNYVGTAYRTMVVTRTLRRFEDSLSGSERLDRILKERRSSRDSKLNSLDYLAYYMDDMRRASELLLSLADFITGQFPLYFDRECPDVTGFEYVYCDARNFWVGLRRSGYLRICLYRYESDSKGYLHPIYHESEVVTSTRYPVRIIEESISAIMSRIGVLPVTLRAFRHDNV